MSSESQTGGLARMSDQGGSIVERLAEKLGTAANITKVYGEPIDRDGITIIPVARVRYGFGGGGGEQKDQRGSGGGGGVQVTPYGYIEVKNGSSEFRRIGAGMNMRMMLAGGIGGLIATRALSMLFRRRRLDRSVVQERSGRLPEFSSKP